MLVISTASCGWLLTVPHPPTHPTPQKLCMKVIEFVDHMARKLRSNRYYLEEREKQDVKLLVMSEKVRLTELCACAYVCVLWPCILLLSGSSRLRVLSQWLPVV